MKLKDKKSQIASKMRSDFHKPLSAYTEKDWAEMRKSFGQGKRRATLEAKKNK